jgi:transposase
MRNSKYTAEFRDSTVQLVIQGEKSVSQIGQDLDVNPKTIYNWIRVYKKAHNMTINSREKSSITSLSKETTQDELKRLKGRE